MRRMRLAGGPKGAKGGRHVCGQYAACKSASQQQRCGLKGVCGKQTCTAGIMEAGTLADSAAVLADSRTSRGAGLQDRHAGN